MSGSDALIRRSGISFELFRQEVNPEIVTRIRRLGNSRQQAESALAEN
jgi:hypothetical protein